MTFNPTQTLQNLQTAIDNTGVFPAGVLIGEPFSPAADQMAALMFHAFRPAGTTLSTTIDIWEFMLRVYAKAGMTPADAEAVEFGLGVTFGQLEAALGGDFTLGGTVRAIDWAGEAGGGRLDAKWGHIVLGGTIFRVFDVIVPVIVDDAVTFHP